MESVTSCPVVLFCSLFCQEKIKKKGFLVKRADVEVCLKGKKLVN